MSIRRVGSTSEQQSVDDDDILFSWINDDQQHHLGCAFAVFVAGARVVRHQATRIGGFDCVTGYCTAKRP
jgi:hypothetical protein